MEGIIPSGEHCLLAFNGAVKCFRTYIIGHALAAA
jgi:hypothetical protein